MNDDEFIRAGIERYADAAAAIKDFRDKLRDAMDRVVKQQKNWGAFTPVLDELNNRRIEISDWVYVLVPGRIGEGQSAGAVELGIWWNPPGTQLSSILYARIKAGEAWIPLKNLHSTTPGIQPIEIQGTGYLFSNADKGLNIDKDLASLLGEIVKNIPAA